MLLTLTDHLTCPACGPAAGLILMMDEVADRRVVRGRLGCPACRAQYAIERGEARLGDDGDAPVIPEDGPAREVDAQRVAALLGLGEGAGFVLVDGPAAAAVASSIAALGLDHEPVVALAVAAPAPRAAETTSVLRTDAGLPLATATMRAVAFVGGTPGPGRLAELLRVCRPTGRVVVEVGTAPGAGDAAPAESADRLDGVASALDSAGAQVRARDRSGLVAVRM